METTPTPSSGSSALESAGPVQEGDEITLRDLLFILHSQRRVLAGTFLAVMVLAILAMVLMSKVYRSETVLVPVTEESGKGGLSGLAGQLGGLASLTGVNLGSSSTAKTEAVAMLKAKSFTADFIREENLLPILFAGSWDEEAGEWEVDEDEIPSMWDAVRKFDRQVRFVVEDSSTGLVTVAIEWRDPAVAAQWGSKLVRRVNGIMRTRAISEAQKSIDYLQTELAKTGVVGIQQSIYSLIEGQIKVIALANTREEYAFRSVDPATVPDLDDFVRPRRLLIFALGIVGGVLLGVLAACLRHALRRGA